MTARPPYKRARVKVYRDKEAKNYLRTKIFAEGEPVSKIGLKVPKSAIKKAQDALNKNLVATLFFAASLLDPFGAEALANPEGDLDGNGAPDYLEETTQSETKCDK